jgi:hypothetical protein
MGISVDEAIGRPAFPFTRTKVELDLVLVSAADLGFPEDGAPIDRVSASPAGKRTQKKR